MTKYHRQISMDVDSAYSTIHNLFIINCMANHEKKVKLTLNLKKRICVFVSIRFNMIALIQASYFKIPYDLIYVYVAKIQIYKVIK